MKRKVIQLAGKTLVVSLPRKWVKKIGVRKGDEVEVEDAGNKVTITANKELGIEKVQVNLDSANPRLMRWALSALHKSGYDEIDARYQNSDAAKILQELVKDLFIGFAVTEQSSNRSVLRSLAREMPGEFDVTLRRAFLVTLSMGESLLEYMNERRFKETRELLALESTNNQLTNFCERILIRNGYREYRKTCFAYVIVWNLEKVCDNYKYIINHIAHKEKMMVNDETISFLGQCNLLLRAYYELYYRFDSSKLNGMIDMKKEAEDKGKSLLGRANIDEAVIVSCLLQHITQVSDFSASFIALNT